MVTLATPAKRLLVSWGNLPVPPNPLHWSALPRQRGQAATRPA